MKRMSLVALLSMMPMLAVAALKTETVKYKHGNADLIGFLAYDDAVTTKRPGILVVHEWYGLNDYAKKRAEQLAGLGFVAFAVDIYGNGRVAKDTKEAGELAGLYKSDRNLLRGRVNAGLKVFQKNPMVDSKKIAAIGYCFGGTTVLELARSGADVAGVVSFHGGLNTPTPNDAKNIKTKVLALHGADDPYVPASEVAAFEDEMRNGKVDWQLTKYSNAVHAFTNPAAGSDNAKGAAYNENADMRSWEAMKTFFVEIFK